MPPNFLFFLAPATRLSLMMSLEMPLEIPSTRAPPVLLTAPGRQLTCILSPLLSRDTSHAVISSTGSTPLSSKLGAYKTDSQDFILVLAFRLKSLKPFKLFPSISKTH